MLILGTSTFPLEIADVAREAGFHIAGFVENQDRDRSKTTLEGAPVYWVEEITDLSDGHLAVCGLGTTKRSRFTRQVEALGFDFATVVHPSAQVSRKSHIGRGCVVGAGVVIGAHSRIADHSLVNRGCLIGHHTAIADHCSLGPGANIAGHCEIADSVFVGMGAVVINRTKIGRSSIVGAGAVVTTDVPDNVLVVGVPAKVVREGVEGL